MADYQINTFHFPNNKKVVALYKNLVKEVFDQYGISLRTVSLSFERWKVDREEQLHDNESGLISCSKREFKALLKKVKDSYVMEIHLNYNTLNPSFFNSIISFSQYLHQLGYLFICRQAEMRDKEAELFQDVSVLTDERTPFFHYYLGYMSNVSFVNVVRSLEPVPVIANCLTEQTDLLLAFCEESFYRMIWKKDAMSFKFYFYYMCSLLAMLKANEAVSMGRINEKVLSVLWKNPFLKKEMNCWLKEFQNYNIPKLTLDCLGQQEDYFNDWKRKMRRKTRVWCYIPVVTVYNEFPFIKKKIKAFPSLLKAKASSLSGKAEKVETTKEDACEETTRDINS